MRGEISSSPVDKRHPYDWYVEEEWVTGQLVAALNDLSAERDAGLAIWDPCAGYGHTSAALQGYGLKKITSDIVHNIDPGLFIGRNVPPFFSADFLELTEAPEPCTILCNPPYSYRKGAGDYANMLISEAFARHALKLAAKRVCMVLPVKWLASQARYRLFTQHPPLVVLHLTQRPSMPPGDRIKAMGNRAFRGGMTDYCWIVWDVTRDTRPGQTRTVWLPPLGAPIPVIEGIG